MIDVLESDQCLLPHDSPNDHCEQWCADEEVMFSYSPVFWVHHKKSLKLVEACELDLKVPGIHRLQDSCTPQLRMATALACVQCVVRSHGYGFVTHGYGFVTQQLDGTIRTNT